MNRKTFGGQLIPVKSSALFTCFEYDEDGKVSYSMKFYPKKPDEKLMGNVGSKIPEGEGEYLRQGVALLTLDGKQRVLPRGVLVCGLADDRREMDNALEKLAVILRNSRQFREAVNAVRQL